MAGRSDEEAAADEITITARYQRLSRAGLLDERGRRLWAATEARAAGRGGLAVIVGATGISESTVRRGLRELDLGEKLPPGRVRRSGAGRMPIARREPGLVEDLERLIEPLSRGVEQSPLRWTCKSAAKLAAELRQRDHRVVDRTVLRLLKARGYSLHANRPTPDGARHPDRDAQFEYVNRTVSAGIAASQPVISVEVRRHVRDVSKWTPVGITSETARLTAHTVLAWWDRLGTERYPRTTALTITADCGGSSSERTLNWRRELQKVSDLTGLELVICHFPAGTTRWDSVEHRLLSTIRHPRRVSPLGDEVVINLIAPLIARRRVTTYAWLDATHARLDEPDSLTGFEISDKQPAALNIVPAAFQGDWNYRVRPSVIKS